MQSQNIFTDGLRYDAHPMLVPNTALTTALNATIVSMNGNENVLQNDMGNARVNRAALPSGYVPVGMKEYGGIIYIAAYNPITGKSQIGSFPSPQRNKTVDESTGLNRGLSCPLLGTDDNGNSILISPITKVELVEGAIIRSGDKFSINLGNLDKSLISNYDYISDNLVTSPQRKRYSIGIATMDKNNQLQDITKQLKRYDDSGNVINFEDTDSELYKFNKGYWSCPSIKGTPTSPVAEVRNQTAINTYNSKLFGKLFAWAQYNMIDTIEVSIIGIAVPKEGQAITTTTLTLPNGISIDTSKITKDTLYYIVNFKYNCPDGCKENKLEPIEGYAQYRDGNESSIVGVSIVENNIQAEGTTFNANPDNISDAQVGYYCPLYNEVTELYSFNQIFETTPTAGDDNIVNWSVTPIMKDDTEFLIPSLTIKGQLDISKLGSGEININTWRYIVEGDQIRLTWGFEAYPRYGESMTEVTFIFTDVYDSNNQIVFITKERASYNGEFTDVFPASYFNTNLETRAGCLYKVKIVWKINDVLIDDTIAQYRWFVPTGLYNASYYGSGTDDKGNRYSQIKDYNNFLECKYYYAKEYNGDGQYYTDGSQLTPTEDNNLKIIPNYYFIITPETELVWKKLSENITAYNNNPVLSLEDKGEVEFVRCYSGSIKYSGVMIDSIPTKYPIKFYDCQVDYTWKDKEGDLNQNETFASYFKASEISEGNEIEQNFDYNDIQYKTGDSTVEFFLNVLNVAQCKYKNTPTTGLTIFYPINDDHPLIKNYEGVSKWFQLVFQERIRKAGHRDQKSFGVFEGWNVISNMYDKDFSEASSEGNHIYIVKNGDSTDGDNVWYSDEDEGLEVMQALYKSAQTSIIPMSSYRKYFGGPDSGYEQGNCMEERKANTDVKKNYTPEQCYFLIKTTDSNVGIIPYLLNITDSDFQNPSTYIQLFLKSYLQDFYAANSDNTTVYKLSISDKYTEPFSNTVILTLQKNENIQLTAVLNEYKKIIQSAIEDSSLNSKLITFIQTTQKLEFQKVIQLYTLEDISVYIEDYLSNLESNQIILKDNETIETSGLSISKLYDENSNAMSGLTIQDNQLYLSSAPQSTIQDYYYDYWAHEGRLEFHYRYIPTAIKRSIALAYNSIALT